MQMPAITCLGEVQAEVLRIRVQVLCRRYESTWTGIAAWYAEQDWNIERERAAKDQVSIVPNLSLCSNWIYITDVTRTEYDYYTPEDVRRQAR
jgi:hypothetical protein